MNQIKAVAHQKYIRQSPRKVRLVADTVRGLDVDTALEQLSYTPKKAAEAVFKVIRQAQANAVNNQDARENSLKITEIQVNQAPILKRWRAVSRGRAHSIEKRMSHLRVTVVGNPKDDAGTADNQSDNNDTKNKKGND